MNNLDLILNDLSIDEQFHDSSVFRAAIGRIKVMRDLAGRFGRELHCHRATVNRMVDPATSVFQQLQTFSREEKTALLVWLTRRGPFWEDVPEHDPGEWFECNGDLVTDTALAEAAYCSTVGIARGLVSILPSAWEYSPVKVTWSTDTPVDIEVDNFWEPVRLEAALRLAEPAITSWDQMERDSRRRFQRLTFAEDCFQDLDGRPFVPSAAKRIISLLDILDRVLGLVDNAGHWTPEGQRLYNNYFTGEKALFSDSSDTEKRQFRRELTFRHPMKDGGELCCPWHGKVNQPPFRIHFSWPVSPSGHLYIVYVGWKITTR